MAADPGHAGLVKQLQAMPVLPGGWEEFGGLRELEQRLAPPPKPPFLTVFWEVKSDFKIRIMQNFAFDAKFTEPGAISGHNENEKRY